MFGLGYQELLLILVIVLVLFGGSKLPDLAKSLGKSMKEFKKGIAAEPEEDSRSSTPARSATVTSTAPRTCSSCQSPMDVAWAHCRRCGTIRAPDSTPTPPK
jgi:sec-independent protein translocase protein TatA